MTPFDAGVARRPRDDGRGADGGEGRELFVIALERFEGPLDLLLHLIRQQDIDIFDIPIATITDQFLRVVGGIGARELEGAGEFVEMAATLIGIKARMLLPHRGNDDDEDPRAELVRRLLEYEQVREISSRLEVMEARRMRRWAKGYVPPRPRPEATDTPLETTWDEVWRAALGVELPRPPAPPRVRTRLVSMEEKIALIRDRLRAVARVEFSRLVGSWGERMHGVMTLLAGLELARRRQVRLRQTRPFAELWLYRRKSSAESGNAPGEAA